MPIKPSEFSLQNQAYQHAVMELNKVSQLEYLPAELKEKLLALHQEFVSYDITTLRKAGKKLSGELLSKEQVKQLVIDATGYKRWDINEDEENKQEQRDFLMTQYGIDITLDEVKCYMVEREVKSRNDIWLIQVTCVPGHVCLVFDTDRVNYGLGMLLSNAQAKTSIAKEF